MADSSCSPKLKDVQRRFDRAAANFDAASFVHLTTFDGLIERLAPVAINPALILDLGSATGRGSRQLAKTFKKSRVISLDLSAEMLLQAKRNKPWFSRLSELSGVTELQGDALQIPLQNASVDLVFANQLLPWIDNLPTALAEIARVLKKGGLIAFATLGPDSFKELRNAWPDDDRDAHVNRFPDMHDVGDGLMQSGLLDPVLDVDYLTVTYADSRALYADLAACGARNTLTGRRRSLTGKQRFARMEAVLDTGREENKLPLTLELVYGHAWGNGPRSPQGEFHLDADTISLRARK